MLCYYLVYLILSFEEVESALLGFWLVGLLSMVVEVEHVSFRGYCVDYWILHVKFISNYISILFPFAFLWNKIGLLVFED